MRSGTAWLAVAALALPAVAGAHTRSQSYSGWQVTERLLRVAERTGQIAAILQTLADRHAERFSATVDRWARLAEPLLLLLVSLAVGTVVVLMYLPIFDLAGGLR